MATGKVVVKTETSLLQDLKALATDFLPNWSKTHPLNFSNTVLASMIVIEKYHGEQLNVGSNDKFNMVESLIPEIINIAVELGLIKQADADSLKKSFVESSEVIQELVETFIELAHNPQLIQVEQAIETEVKGCFAGCKKPTQK